MNGYQINEISSDSGFTDESTTVVTEEVAGFTGGDLTDKQNYLRKQFYKSSTSILSSFTFKF